MRRSISIFLLFAAMYCSSAVDGQLNATPNPAGQDSTKTNQLSSTIQLTYIGTFGDKTAFKSPWGISFSIDSSLYVCDRDNSAVVRLDKDGQVVSRFSGFDSRREHIFLPIDVSVSGGIEVYVLDSANSRVVRFDRNLKNFSAVFEGGTEEGHRFGSFSGIAFDVVSGDIFITDRDNGTVVRIDMLGGNIHATGVFGSEKQSLHDPAGLDVSGDGTLVIADRGSGAVALQSHFGSEIRHIGQNLLEAPVDIAVLPNSLLAVADNRKVIILGRDGTLKVIIETCKGVSIFPRSVAFSEGKLYISDAESASILVYSITYR